MEAVNGTCYQGSASFSYPSALATLESRNIDLANTHRVADKESWAD